MYHLSSLRHRRPSDPSIVQLLAIWKVAQAFQIKGYEELLRRYERVGRTPSRATGASRDQFSRVQTPNQITTDLFAKYFLQPVTGDRLVIGDGGEHRDIEFTEV
jgi:hypothetical protein